MHFIRPPNIWITLERTGEFYDLSYFIENTVQIQVTTDRYSILSICYIVRFRTPFTLSTAKNDMVAYSKLTDSVFYEILHSSNDKLKPAREILEKIQQRKLMELVGQTKPRAEKLERVKSRNIDLGWNDDLNEISSYFDYLLSHKISSWPPPIQFRCSYSYRYA